MTGDDTSAGPDVPSPASEDGGGPAKPLTAVERARQALERAENEARLARARAERALARAQEAEAKARIRAAEALHPSSTPTGTDSATVAPPTTERSEAGDSPAATSGADAPGLAEVPGAAPTTAPSATAPSPAAPSAAATSTVVEPSAAEATGRLSRLRRTARHGTARREEPAAATAPAPVAPTAGPSEPTPTIDPTVESPPAAAVTAAAPQLAEVPATASTAAETEHHAETPAEIPAQTGAETETRTDAETKTETDAETTTDTETETGDDADAPRRRQLTLLTAVAAVAAAAAAVFAIVSGVSWAGGNGSGSSATSKARDAAVLAARQDITVVNTLDYRSVDESLARWQAASTGALQSSIMATPAATKTQLASAKAIATGTVLDVAATALDPGVGTATVIASVQVNVMVSDGTTSMKRMREMGTMTRTSDGSWKLSALGVVS